MKIIRFDKQIKQKWKSQKITKDFNKIPGSKILGNPVLKNPGIPGFGKIPSRKILGLKFLIQLGPGPHIRDNRIHWSTIQCLFLTTTLDFPSEKGFEQNHLVVMWSPYNLAWVQKVVSLYLLSLSPATCSCALPSCCWQGQVCASSLKLPLQKGTFQ